MGRIYSKELFSLNFIVDIFILFVVCNGAHAVYP